MEELSEYDLKEREKYLQKAKSAESFNDAVFYIIYYNTDRKRWRPRPKPEDIGPEEVFSEFDEVEYQQVLEQSKNLLSKTAYIGAAFFKYESSKETYEQAVGRMKSEYPGYGKDIYGLVCNSSITAMR